MIRNVASLVSMCLTKQRSSCHFPDLILYRPRIRIITWVIWLMKLIARWSRHSFFIRFLRQGSEDAFTYALTVVYFICLFFVDADKMILKLRAISVTFSSICSCSSCPLTILFQSWIFFPIFVFIIQSPKTKLEG